MIAAFPPILAAVGDSAYNVVALLHLIAVIVGFGAAIALPVATVRSRRDGVSPDALEGAGGLLVAPALLLAGVFGGALVGLSSDAYEFSQTWLMLAGPLWIIALVLAALAYPPMGLMIGNLTASRRGMCGGLLHLTLTVLLVLMVWKPGF